MGARARRRHMADEARISRRWAFLAAGVVVTLGLGMWGSFLAEPSYSALDSLYQSLQLFGLQLGDTTRPVPWPLEVARFAAPALTITTAIVAALILSRDRVDAWRAGRRHGHVVVCGLEGYGGPAALALRASGSEVVGIVHDQGDAGPMVRRCRSAGILVVRGDPANPAVLEQAGTERADHLVVLTPDVERAGRVAFAASNLPRDRVERPLVIHLEVGSPELVALLQAAQVSRHRAASWRLEELDLAGAGARTILDTLDPWPDGAEDAEVVVVGSTPLADAVAIEAARRWRRAGRGRESLSVTRLDPEDAAGAATDAPAYLCLDDEAQALATALRLAQTHPSRPVLVHLQTTSSLGELLHRDSPMLRVIRLDAAMLTPEMLLDSTTERIARALHDNYRRAAPESDPSAVAWDDLPEDLRASNRAQAAHVADKLGLVDRVLVPDDGTSTDGFSPDEVERLAVLEHDRWVAEREAAGWTRGPRDATARTSPYLVGWDELDEPTREIDRRFVRALPMILEDAGLLLRRVPGAAPDREQRAPRASREPRTGQEGGTEGEVIREGGAGRGT